MSAYISAEQAKKFVNFISEHIDEGYVPQGRRPLNMALLREFFESRGLQGYNNRRIVDRELKKAAARAEATENRVADLIFERADEVSQLPAISKAKMLLEGHLAGQEKREERKLRRIAKQRTDELMSFPSIEKTKKQLEGVISGKEKREERRKFRHAEQLEREFTRLLDLRFPEEPESEKVAKIREQLKSLKTGKVNLEGLNNKELHQVESLLKEYIDTKLGADDVLNQKGEYKRVQIIFWFYGDKDPKRFNIDADMYTILKDAIEDETIFYNKESLSNLYIETSGGVNEEAFEWNFVKAFEVVELDNGAAKKKNRARSFLPYVFRKGNLCWDVYNAWKEQLARYQIFTNIKDHKEELQDCCFVYALKMAGVDRDTLNKIKLTRINDRTLSYNIVDDICKEHKIKLLIRDIKINNSGSLTGQRSAVRSVDSSHSPKGYTGPDPAYDIVLDSICDHYLLHEKTKTTTDFLKHFDKVPASYMTKRLSGSKWRNAEEPSRFVNSGDFVKWLIEHNILQSIKFADYYYIPTIKKPELSEVKSLSFENYFCIGDRAREDKRKENWKSSDKPHTYWFADFEADVTGAFHRAYMCCLQSEDGADKQTFVGEDCAEALLKYLPDEAVVYFHNLGYDCCFLAKYGASGRPIQKSARKMISMNIGFDDKLIHLKDSLALIPAPIKAFPSMFGLTDIQKERFPYKYYTLDRLASNIGVIAGCGSEEDVPWGSAEYAEFVRNIDSIPGCRLSPTTFDMYKYCEFYCQQDVNVLREGYNYFRENILKEFDLDIHNILTISSVAYQYINNKVFTNAAIKSYSGIVDQVIRQTIYGGRCMTAKNRCYHIKKRLQDYDGVSLYPSAMSRMEIPLGAPKVITNCSYDFLKKQDFYVAEVEITKVNKKRDFPLIVMNDGLTNINTNGDGSDVFGVAEGQPGLVKDPSRFIISPEQPYRCWLNKISLEDLIEFQSIEFTVLRGYYWNEGVDTSIQEVIRNMFLTRRKYKSEHNPVQNVYKLILNSVYGKTIQKPIEEEIVYKWKSEAAAYREKNYSKIIEETELANGRSIAFKVRKATQFQFSYSLVGSIVLAMSKRIMNEVMCLAEDIGCHIYYQDTDSMHIEVDDIPKLEAAFKEKYGRELCGKDLGQFHCDFESDKGEVLYSEESYILAKKLYLDVLRIADGSTDLHVRGKGITRKAIDAAANKNNEDLFAGIIDLYKSLYEGVSIQFDLAIGSPCFDFNAAKQITSLKNFFRTVSVGKEVTRNEVF